MTRSFSAWKTEALARLIELERRYANDQEALQTLEGLVKRLLRLRRRDVIYFLAILREGARTCPELLDLFPEPEEVAEWFQEG